MKKVFIALFSLICVLGLVACGAKTEAPAGKTTIQASAETTTKAAKTYTVQFYNGEELLKTLKVKENEAVAATDIPAVTVDGYALKGWSLTLNGEIVDMTATKITQATKFYAVMEEVEIDDGLDVECKKEEGKEYYLVVGWWETTAKEDDGTPKVTSGLTKTIVKHWYQNLKVYLQKFGATEEQLNNIQFRNYSTEKVAEMGALINADGDVDLMIGVGNNINSDANVSLLDGSNDNKVGGIVMSSVTKGRYVALLKNNPAAVSVFDWIKLFDQGKSSFQMNVSLKVDEITLATPRDQEVTYEVTVVGSTELKTKLVNDEDVIQTTNVEIPEGKELVGFATAADGEAVVVISDLSKLTLAMVKSLFVNGAVTLTLYPVFKDAVVATEDLVVYVQINGSFLTEAEAFLIKERFESTLTEPKNIKWEFCKQGADDFKTTITTVLATGYVDVIIGGNSPLKNFEASESGALAVCSTGHFVKDDRRVLISSSSKNAELASKLYTYMTTASTEYTLGIEFWRVGKWVTTTEVSNLKAGITSYVLSYFGVDDEAALLSTYNVKIAYYESGKDGEGNNITAVADLSKEARTLKNGKSVDLIVGAGPNICNKENMPEASEPKAIPTSMVEAGRQVSYINGNLIAKAIYTNYFKETPATE